MSDDHKGTGFYPTRKPSEYETPVNPNHRKGPQQFGSPNHYEVDEQYGASREVSKQNKPISGQSLYTNIPSQEPLPEYAEIDESELSDRINGEEYSTVPEDFMLPPSTTNKPNGNDLQGNHSTEDVFESLAEGVYDTPLDSGPHSLRMKSRTIGSPPSEGYEVPVDAWERKTKTLASPPPVDYETPIDA